MDLINELLIPLDTRLGARRSLCPTRAAATPLAALAAQLVESRETPAARAFVRGLARIAEAIIEHFPDNIYWDLDALAAVLSSQADADAITAMADQVVRLQAGFGRHTEIRFRYAHDFLFGFDWARWVAKDPDARAVVGPFDPVFLDYLESRREQLVELIAADDRKYPTLDGDAPRNPFGFSREPTHEQLLHDELARTEGVPAEAWDLEPRLTWKRPYAELREQIAQRLGIPLRP